MGNALVIEMHERILEEYYSRGFISIYVFGKEGSGKTSYALWLGYTIYGNWDTTLNHLFLEPRPFLATMLRALERKSKLKYVIVDDPGRWLNKLDWMRDDVKAFTRFYNIIRTSVCGVIFTSPADDVITSIRKKSHVRGRVYRIRRYLGKKKAPRAIKLILKNMDYLRNFYDIDLEEEEYSVSRLMDMELNIMFKEYPVISGIELYPTYYPDDVYVRYEEMRRHASIKDLRNMLRMENVENLYRVVQAFGEDELIALSMWVLNRVLKIPIRSIADFVHFSKSKVHRAIKWVDEKLNEYVESMPSDVLEKAIVNPPVNSPGHTGATAETQ